MTKEGGGDAATTDGVVEYSIAPKSDEAPPPPTHVHRRAGGGKLQPQSRRGMPLQSLTLLMPSEHLWTSEQHPLKGNL